MLVLRRWLPVLLLLLLAAGAYAQVPSGNVFFGYSYVNADTNLTTRANLNGWDGSLEGKVLPFVGIVADISGNYGTRDFPVLCPTLIPCPNLHANAKVHSALFGPRVSVSVGKFTPFAHALLGVSHISASTTGFSTSDTSLGVALGGGVDYRVIHGLAWRVQMDMLRTRFFNNTQDNFRLSTGVVLRF